MQTLGFHRPLISRIVVALRKLRKNNSLMHFSSGFFPSEISHLHPDHKTTVLHKDTFLNVVCFFWKVSKVQLNQKPREYAIRHSTRNAFHPCDCIKFMGIPRDTFMYSIPPAAGETCWQSDQMSYWVFYPFNARSRPCNREDGEEACHKWWSGEKERERGGCGEGELEKRERKMWGRSSNVRGKNRRQKGREMKKENRPETPWICRARHNKSALWVMQIWFHLHVKQWNCGCSFFKATLCCVCSSCYDLCWLPFD